jgi:phosphoribosylanthranilate isomerase
MFRVKVCGITNWTDARRAVECGADALGFNFYRRSPRYISPHGAAKIIARLPGNIACVGVFVDEPLEAVLRARNITGIHLAQLHGDEAPETVARIAERIVTLKALRMSTDFRVADLSRYKSAEACLLDGFHSRLRGGTGRTIDWTLARRAARYAKIVLAGGLNPHNIAEAMRKARPAAVDVNSGVESAPGRKALRKLEAFFAALDPVKKYFA